jgi:acetyltransferase-like isoleucine patch superfamily enzyme
VTPDTPAARAFREFGSGSVIAFPAGSVFGEGWITVGRGTLIGALVTMSAGIVPGQDLGPDPVLRIGDRCVIGRGSHIVAHQSVVIGDDVWTGPPVNQPFTIVDGSWVGAGAIVLPGARIGCNVVVAAGSVVRGEVPDLCVVAGVPAKIVRQHTKAGWLPPQRENGVVG